MKRVFNETAILIYDTAQTTSLHRCTDQWSAALVSAVQHDSLLQTTTCRRAAATICPRRPSPSFMGKRRRAHRKVAFPTPNTRSPLQLPDALRPRCIKRPGYLDLWPFDLESGVRVTCDVSYPYANFSLPSPLCSRLRPNIRYRQTSDVRQMSDVRQKHRLMPTPIRGGGIITVSNFRYSGRLAPVTPKMT